MTTSRLPYGESPPDSWDVVPLKYLATLTNGYVFNSADRTDAGTPIIRIENLNGSRNFNHSGSTLHGRYSVKSGDLLFSWSGNPGTSFGPYLWDEPGNYYLNQHIFNVGVSGCDVRWLYWSLKAATHWIERELTSGMIGMVHVTKEELSAVPIPVPPVELQRRIADFLDAETARIDRMMRLRNEQLRLWNMRHQSVLHSQFVANSTDNGAGQDSTWLGRLPLGWTVPTIGRIARFTMGTTFPHEYQGRSQGDYPFIKVGDFRLADEVDNLGTAENWISRDVAHTLGARIVPAGSVLYARVGAALLLNRRRVTTCPSVIDDNVRAITFAGGVPHYWRALLSLLDMGQLVNPGPVPSIGETQVAAVRVPTAPPAAQREIADRVQQHQRQLNQVTSAIQWQVNLLAERRQALINAAVTGQFDVTTASGRNVTDGVSA
ncbi:restriction endonuclease subunit S [Streptomyces sp. NPDC058107]|uniref:restriction endonuclease subunit S n=1 Tax=Streptomyces sp. NPDC058107 TaxID=3346343 RepID=UPI0036F1346A